MKALVQGYYMRMTGVAPTTFWVENATSALVRIGATPELLKGVTSVGQGALIGQLISAGEARLRIDQNEKDAAEKAAAKAAKAAKRAAKAQG